MSCSVFFAGFLFIIFPEVGFLHDFSAPGVGPWTFFVPGGGGGEFALSKIPQGFARGWPGLELADT